ncbi:MAG: hypothetical protein AAGD06_32870, partial [Acidobacteriota bacterium]
PTELNRAVPRQGGLDKAPNDDLMDGKLIPAWRFSCAGLVFEAQKDVSFYLSCFGLQAEGRKLRQGLTQISKKIM